MRPEHTDMDNEDQPPGARSAAKQAARTGRIVRVGLLVVATGLACVFTAAFWINPYAPDGTPRTMATHTQLGMPACNFVVMTSKPCPACGMTTSFALLVRGDVVASLRANWAGTIIAVLWALTLVWALASGIAGRLLLIPRGRGEILLTMTVGVVLALMLIRWVGVLIQG